MFRLRWTKRQASWDATSFIFSPTQRALIDRLQDLQDESDAIICNPAGLTNYGLSLRDALAETERDLAITHLTNIHAREEWRRHDVFAEVADIYLAGLG